MYHVLFQQFGINISVNQLIIDYRYALWKWSGFLSVAILFTYQSFKALSNIESASSIFTIINLEKISLFLLIFSTALFLTTSIYIIKKTKDALGFCYAGLNIVMILAIVIFSFTPYVVFAIVIPRIIHDFTAFMIYINHDINKKNDHSILYKPLVAFKLPIFIIRPILVIIFSFLMQSHELFQHLIIGCALFHYFIEGFIWKRDSPHRKYISFK